MTFEEACKALGYIKPPEWMEERSRAALVATVERFSENGAKSIDKADALRIRAEVEMFG